MIVVFTWADLRRWFLACTAVGFLTGWMIWALGRAVDPSPRIRLEDGGSLTLLATILSGMSAVDATHQLVNELQATRSNKELLARVGDIA